MDFRSWPDDSIFQHFTVFEETYKIVDGHDIKAAFIIPKNLKHGSHPVICNYHGGYLVYAHSLFAQLLNPWVLKLALENDGIVISANYRLLPTEKGVSDILEDLEDFWLWTKISANNVLRERALGHSLDFRRLLLTGNSAGGFCAAHVALSHPDEISAVALAYPFVNPKDSIMAHGPSPSDPSIFRFPVDEMVPKDEVVDWIAKAKKTVVSRAEAERAPFAMAACQWGLYDSAIFDPQKLNLPELTPLGRLQAGGRLPKRMWILHGDNDTVVYLRTSRDFVHYAQENLHGTMIRFDIAKGEEHGFDLGKTAWELHAPGALDFVKESWLH